MEQLETAGDPLQHIRKAVAPLEHAGPHAQKIDAKKVEAVMGPLMNNFAVEIAAAGNVEITKPIGKSRG